MKVKNSKLKKTLRGLSVNYTLEESQVLNDISDELAVEIKHEIMSNLFELQGWFMVKSLNQEWNTEEISMWLSEHCTKHYFQGPWFCQFESQEDATLFRLTWT